jgi:hypothetical protein
MPYPSRGAWLFRNIDRDFTFWPQLSSVTITQEHPTGLANLDCRVVLTRDEAGLVFDVEDECEVTFDGTRIWAGHLKGVTEEQASEHASAAYVLSGHDYTAKLDDAIVRRKKTRKRERVKRRVRWLLSYMKSDIWTIDTIDLSGLDAIADHYVEAYDYFGSTVREGLDHVADELRLFFFIDLDNTFRMFRGDTSNGPFDLDNVAPDYATTFPFQAFTRETDSTGLGTVYGVEPKSRGDTRWRRDDTGYAAYGRQERFISDSDLPGPNAAINVALRGLAQDATPDEEITVVVHEPGLYAGMTVDIEEAVWGHSLTRLVESVEIRALDPHDASGEALLRSEVKLIDKRKARRHARGNGGSGTATGKVDRNGQPHDPKPQPLVEFDCTTTPPTMSDGSALTVAYAGRMQKGRDHVSQEDYGPSWLTAAAKPAGVLAGDVLMCMSGASPYTLRPAYMATCASPFTFAPGMGGYRDHEQWYKITMPAHPGSLAGVQITVSPDNIGGTHGPGYGEVAPLDVVVRSSPPTDTRQGTVVGSLMVGDSKDLLIAAADVPAEGEVLYIGFRASWETPLKEEVDGHGCSWQWPFECNESDVDYMDRPYLGYSGAYGVNTPSAAKFMVWDSTEAELCSTAAGGDILDGGTEGSPTWGIDGESFNVEAEEPAGKALLVLGQDEDEDQPEGDHSDVAWGVDFEFELDAVGDTGEAGQRHIELTTTGKGEQFVGRVQLGDGDYASGVLVAGPSEVEHKAVTLTTGERWRARFDTRAGYVRGKLWKVADGQPALWDVQVDMTETEHDLDRWQLWVRVGNGTGNSQEVKVFRMRTYAAAGTGQRVVKEWTGLADGVTNVFPTAHRYVEGSLRAFVNGNSAAPSVESGEAATYSLDFWPTARSRMRCTYVAE